MHEARLSRLLFGIPVLLGGGALLGLALARPACETPGSAQAIAAAPALPSEPVAPASDFAALRTRVRHRIARLGRRLPPDLVIAEHPPFLVVSDEPPERVRHHLERSIRWAARLLKALYFTKDPSPLEIWLGADAVGYVLMTQALFGEAPVSPYGFYVAERQIMIMNIQTGGGTLVHELVHAFMEANLPGSPPWLNEGLGSLYEMVGERDGRIWGFVNWRLPPLQEAIRARRTLPFPTLLALPWKPFYASNSAVHYGQARYLLYYLQSRGLLVPFYRAYQRARATDPTGVATLRAVLGEPDLEAFRRRWERWVLGLRYAPQVLVTSEDAAAISGDPVLDPPPALR